MRRRSSSVRSQWTKGKGQYWCREEATKEQHQRSNADLSTAVAADSAAVAADEAAGAAAAAVVAPAVALLCLQVVPR